MDRCRTIIQAVEEFSTEGEDIKPIIAAIDTNGVAFGIINAQVADLHTGITAINLDPGRTWQRY